MSGVSIKEGAVRPRLRNLSLFSGIGGLELAAEWAQIETVGFVERDPYCIGILRRHWPQVPIIEDVRELTRETLSPIGSIEIVSGGFPCQPHSLAGKRKASGDDRDLWPEFARVICEVAPRWVVAENVPGLRSSERGRFFGRVLGDLASMGYNASWCSFEAYDVGAAHARNRLGLSKGSGNGLNVAVKFSLWPTPTTRDYASEYSLWPTPTKCGNDDGKLNAMLNVGVNALLGRAVHWDGKQKGSLNPEWVTWLMGFPDGWLVPDTKPGKSNPKSRARSSTASKDATNSGSSATQSSPRKRTSSTKRS